MANTPNYNLPLFETNSIPSWLRDWNTAMTDIDSAIHNVQTQVTAQSASVTNAVNTANAASATATNVSNDVDDLTTRVTALEAGGGGGTPPTLTIAENTQESGGRYIRFTVSPTTATGVIIVCNRITGSTEWQPIIVSNFVNQGVGVKVPDSMLTGQTLLHAVFISNSGIAENNINIA